MTFEENLLKNIGTKIAIVQEYQKLYYNYLESINELYKFITAKQCSKAMKIKIYLDYHGKKHYRTVRRKDSCKDKFCPICNWQTSKKNKNKIAKTLKRCVYKDKYKLVLITLNASAVKENDLASQLNKLQRATGDLMRNRKITKQIRGYIKKLEITYNPATDTYNPHYHIIIAMQANYFKNGFITFKYWLEAWQRAIKTNAGIHVNNRINIKGNKIFALSNYLSKPIVNYKEPIKQNTFNVLHTALAGKQILRGIKECRF